MSRLIRLTGESLFVAASLHNALLSGTAYVPILAQIKTHLISAYLEKWGKNPGCNR
jgi:hypothetical protein